MKRAVWLVTLGNEVTVGFGLNGLAEQRPGYGCDFFFGWELSVMAEDVEVEVICGI
jgi:hypothetical protein